MNMLLFMCMLVVVYCSGYSIDIDKPIEYIKLGPSPVLSFVHAFDDSIVSVDSR